MSKANNIACSYTFRVRPIVLLILAVLLASCGGSGGGSTDLAPPIIEDEPTDGIWSGLFTSVIDSTASGVIGLVSVQNETQLVAATVSGRHYAGTLATAGNVLIGTLNIYRDKVGPFYGSGGVDSIDINGTTLGRARLSGDFTGDDEGQFALNYNADYENGSSLAVTSGTWLYTEPSAAGPDYTVTLDIDGAGAIFGTDSAGCIYSGQLGLIDEAFNGYSVAVTVSECQLDNGDYGGLGWISSVDGGLQNLLTLGMSKNSPVADRAFAASFLRL